MDGTGASALQPRWAGGRLAHGGGPDDLGCADGGGVPAVQLCSRQAGVWVGSDGAGQGLPECGFVQDFIFAVTTDRPGPAFQNALWKRNPMAWRWRARHDSGSSVGRERRRSKVQVKGVKVEPEGRDVTNSRVFAGGPDGLEARDLPELRLFNAVARWDAAYAAYAADPGAVVDAACQALVDGLDSPALRELAGMSARDRRDEVEPVVTQTLLELGVPRAADLPSGYQVAAGGGVEPRPGTDTVRFNVAPVPEDTESGGGFEVQIYVNDVEMTSAGAGLGMDPYDVFVATNRLRATTEARRVPVARCDCGVYGCGMTDVLIRRDGDLVHWDWLEEVPMKRGVTFPAAAYDCELDRLERDRSWETPERRAGRLILENADHAALAAHDLKFDWLNTNYRDPTSFTVCLRQEGRYQVFLDIAWKNRSPEELAAAAVAELAKSPRRWRARWLANDPRHPGRPKFAGRRWREYSH